MPPRKNESQLLQQILQRKDFRELCRKADLDPDQTGATIGRLAVAMEKPQPVSAPNLQPSLLETGSGSYPVVKLYTDGAARGNPGPASAGAWWCDAAGNPIGELSRTLGVQTNNVAEYEALRLALIELKSVSIGRLEILADSQLMIRQILGQYRVKNSHLLPLYNEVMAHLARYKKWNAHHIPREENARADALANAALDKLRKA